MGSKIEKEEAMMKKKAAKEKLQITSPGPVSTATMEAKPISTIFTDTDGETLQDDAKVQDALQKPNATKYGEDDPTEPSASSDAKSEVSGEALASSTDATIDKEGRENNDDEEG